VFELQFGDAEAGHVWVAPLARLTLRPSFEALAQEVDTLIANGAPAAMLDFLKRNRKAYDMLWEPADHGPRQIEETGLGEQQGRQSMIRRG
jgi:hypothetical protein